MYNEFVDPNLRTAINNMSAGVSSEELDPIVAQKKGLLKIEEPPEYSYGTPLNEAVMKRARDKFYDPEISKGMQEYKYATGQGQKLANAANNILGLYQLDRQAEEIVRQRKAAEDSQRAQVLSSVLGLGGAVAGAMMAGPAGGAVGYQAGSSIGQSASGRSPAQTRQM